MAATLQSIALRGGFMPSYKRVSAVLFVVGGLSNTFAHAQIPANPTQSVVSSQQDRTPLFRVTVVGRTTPAINYRPRSGSPKIDFAGPPLMPAANGQRAF